MRLSFAVLPLLCTLFVAACNRDDRSRSPSGGGNDGGSVGSGDRLGWEQPLDDVSDLASIRFRLWIDDVAADMAGVTCGDTINLVASCSGSLRAMTAGRHTLALSMVLADGSESARSEPLSVAVGGSGAAAALVSGDGLRILAARNPEPARGALTAWQAAAVDPAVSVDQLTDGLADPTGLAIAGAERVFIAERGGVVREWRGGGLAAEPLLVIDDIDIAAGGGLLGIALDRDYVRNGLVFLAYTAPTGLRVARYRLVDATLGEAAVLFETVPDTQVTSAVLRTGPDGLLYFGVDNGGDGRRSGDLGSYGGKVLRLDRDGRVPETQAGYGPMYLSDLREPRAVTWSPTTGHIWVADAGHGADGLLIEAQDDGRGLRGVITSRFGLPRPDAPATAHFYRGDAIPEWRNNMLVGLQRSGELWRVTFTNDGHTAQSTHVVLNGAPGAIAAVDTDSTGRVYLLSGQSLLRITPAR